MFAREEIEIGLADELVRFDAHAIRHQLVGGGEAALRVLRVDEGGDQVDHRPQDVALVRERIREVAALGAGAIVRVCGIGRDGLWKAVHGTRLTAPEP